MASSQGNVSGHKLGSTCEGLHFRVVQGASLNFEQEVVVSLVGKHKRGPVIAVGLPLLVLPFDAFKVNCCGGFTDLLQVCAGGLWG